jgi:hypothetical protein
MNVLLRWYGACTSWDALLRRWSFTSRFYQNSVQLIEVQKWFSWTSFCICKLEKIHLDRFTAPETAFTSLVIQLDAIDVSWIKHYYSHWVSIELNLRMQRKLQYHEMCNFFLQFRQRKWFIRWYCALSMFSRSLIVWQRNLI